MERYFILMILMTPVGITVQKKNRQETNFRSTRQEERKMTAAILCENNVNYTNALTTDDNKFKISPDVVNEENVYEIVGNKNSIQKIIKRWSRRVNKMSCRANARLLFNILRSAYG